MNLDIEIVRGSKVLRHKSNSSIKLALEWLYLTKRKLTDFDYIEVRVFDTVFTTRGKEYMPREDKQFYTFQEAREFISNLE
ncbi:hypothetical protein M0R04_10740 [Candidatus Dojkabacteria bacterium]|jgi:hypothetical protein|nr:hypothetical protein [Candidatus Dojkabacteria bacterium]